mgnify:CR=1 FL=1
MTQRFEYETNGSWEDPLGEIVLIFKRRPQDASLLGKNRDRINLRTSELTDIIIKDFAQTMTNEELANAILSFEPIWNTKYGRTTKDNMAYYVFESLVKVAVRRNIQFDFKDKKFAAGCSRDVIKEGAERLGWTLDELLDKTILAMRSCEASVNEEMAKF